LLQDHAASNPSGREYFHPPWANNSIDTQREVTFVVHSARAGAESLRSEIQQAGWQADGSLPVAWMQTLGELYSRSMARSPFTLVMLPIAGEMALALSLIGTYGVICLRRIAAYARDRHSHGARSAEGRVALDVCAVSSGAEGRWRRHWRGSRSSASADDKPSRSVKLRGRAAHSRRCIGRWRLFLPASRVAAVNPVDALKDK
jgi:hypothetical protein